MRTLKIALLVLLLALLLPIAAIAGIFDKGRKSTPSEFAAELQKLADGREGDYDWDDFECVRMCDPRLEEIRQEALKMAWPPTNDDKGKLRRLAARAAALPPQLQ